MSNGPPSRRPILGRINLARPTGTLCRVSERTAGLSLDAAATARRLGIGCPGR